jgi:hypothetical protein
MIFFDRATDGRRVNFEDNDTFDPERLANYLSEMTGSEKYPQGMHIPERRCSRQ